MASTDQADAADMESGYSDDTAPAATPEPAKQDAVDPAAAQPPAVPAEPVDPMKVVLEKLDKLEARARNVDGHIGGLNHRAKVLEETMEAASKAAAKTVTDAPTQTQVKEAMASPAEWDALREDYPEWAAATEKFMDAKLAALPAPQALDPAAIEKIVGERVAGQTAEVRKEIISASLEAVFPGWAEDVRTPQYAAWIALQKPEVKALAASDKVGDAARLLRLFDQSKHAKPEEVKPPVKDVPTRNKRFEAAVNPRGTGGHASGGSSEIDEMEAGYSG